jgi:hypothetical protein
MRLSPDVTSPFIRFVGFALVFERVFSDADKGKRELLGFETNRK